jgi:hypothetical protein
MQTTTQMRSMTTCVRSKSAPGIAAALAAFVLLCAPALATGTVSPLPASAYTTRAVCAPPAPGYATCQSVQLLARTAQARAYVHPLGVTRAPAETTPSPAAGDFGLTPQDIHSAYQLPTSASGTQTIALVDVYNDLSAEADLETYDTEFGLPQCTTANGCFKQVNQNGEAANLPFPQSRASLTGEETLCEGGSEEACALLEEAQSWTVEISLDIESAHATCQSCHIALVEAKSSSYTNLEAAEEAAVRLPAQEISNSWAGAECVEGYGCVEDSAAFNHPGTVITAAAGDDGFLNWLEEPRSDYANFPASSPHVVAVGGTRLVLGTKGERVSESVWNDGGKSGGVKDGFGAGGGGCSTNFVAPAWQKRVSNWSTVGCAGKRAIADVSADADPYTGLAVYDSSPECETSYEEEGEKGEQVVHSVHWCTIGGTSLASPLIASVFALAGGAQGVEYPARALYENVALAPTSLYDVTEGSNGECLSAFNAGTGKQGCTAAQDAKTSCSSQPICLAGVGYDGPSGVGAPDGITAFQPPEGSGEGEGSEEGLEEKGKEEEEKSEEKRKLETPSGSGEHTEGNTFEKYLATHANPSGGGSTSSTGTTTAPSTASARLSELELTLHALIALNSGRPKISKLGFTFTINVAAYVRVSLEKRVGKHRHAHWHALIHRFTIAALSGRNTRTLSGHGVLSPGSYRLLLTPAHGAARAVAFTIG